MITIARSAGALLVAGALVGCVTERVPPAGGGTLPQWALDSGAGPTVYDARGQVVPVQEQAATFAASGAPGAPPLPAPGSAPPFASPGSAGAMPSTATAGAPGAVPFSNSTAVMPVPLTPLGPAAATAPPQEQPPPAPPRPPTSLTGAFGEPLSAQEEQAFGFSTPFGVFDESPATTRPDRLGSAGGLLGLLPSTDVSDDDSLLGLISPATESDAATGLLRLIEPAGAADVEPDVLGGPPSPFHRLGRNLIRGVDGTWSKLYVLREGRSDPVVGLLQGHVPGFPAEPGVPFPPDAPVTEQIRYVLHKGFYGDETETIGTRKQITGKAIADMLVVTAPPQTLVFIDELLGKVLADVAQIELAVRVVEVNLDDTIDWDSQLRLLHLEDGSLPFDPVTNPPSGNFGSGIPITDGTNPTGIGSIFNSLPSLPTTGVQGFAASLLATYGDLRIESIISLLQTIGAAKLISSPTVTVLNGHHATLSTGDEVPVFEATGVNVNPTITTKFKETGVQIDIVPFIVGEDVVRIDLAIDVSAVTATVDFVLSGTTVSNPIISQRDAGSTVLVNSGQTFSIGGLIASENIETISKVPFLGDLPLLGWLFKSRSSIRTNTEIVFFITPRIIYPSESLLDPLAY